MLLIAPILALVLFVVMLAAVFALGFVVHRIQTARDIARRHACPSCEHRVRNEATLCPSCRSELSPDTLLTKRPKSSLRQLLTSSSSKSAAGSSP